jgi:hypothetical protein
MVSRSWIFSTDPEFREKAGWLLDLYNRQWEDKPAKTGEDELVSALTRRRAFQRGAASIPLSQVSPAVLVASRIDTNAVGLGCTSVL